jgi:hypothetical protein
MKYVVCASIAKTVDTTSYMSADENIELTAEMRQLDSRRKCRATTRDDMPKQVPTSAAKARLVATKLKLLHAYKS